MRIHAGSAPTVSSQLHVAVTPSFALRAIGRRKALVAVVVLGVMAGDTWILSMTPTEYQAQVLLQVDRRNARPVDGEVRSIPVDMDGGGFSSELNIIDSPKIALQVIGEQHLLDTPEFAAALSRKASGYAASAWRWAARWLPASLVATLRPEQAADPAQMERIREQDAIAFFTSRLGVSYDQRGGSLWIRYRSADPVVTANVANAVANAYVDQQIRSKLDLLRSARTWLDERVDRLKAKWEESEKALAKFREEHHLGTSQAPVFTQQQLAALNAKYVEVRSHEAEISARLGRLEAAAAAHNLDSVADVLDSPTIQKLREQEAQIGSSVAAAEGDARVSMLTVERLRAGLDEVRRQVKAEMQRILASLRNELAIKRMQRDLLESSIAGLTKVAESRDQASIHAVMLERQVAANRAIVDAVLRNVEEARTLDGLQRPDVRIVSEARVPGRPFIPRTRIVLGLGSVAALLLAVSSAVLLEFARMPIRSMSDGERLLGVACVGWLPQLRLRRRAHAQDGDGNGPRSVMGECLYSVALSIRSGIQRDKFALLVTSALPGEGKTAFALSYARMLAAAGRVCLVIDADIRRPAIAGRLGGSASSGLSDLPSGGLDLGALVQHDPRSKLDFIGVGRGNRDPLAILDSREFAALIAAARRRYDAVIIDSPPLMATADPVWLSRHVDAAVVVVRWRDTPARVAKDAIERLVDKGLEMVGFVLSGVDAAKLRRYDAERHGLAYAKRVPLIATEARRSG